MNNQIEKYKIFKSVFSGPAGEQVLNDLAKYCMRDKTTTAFDADSRLDVNATLVREGMRRVYLYIQNQLKEPLILGELDHDKNFDDAA